MTKRQKEVLNFLKEFKEKWSYMPTTRDIADHFGFNQTSAQNNLTALAREGYITRKARKARGITINPI